MEFIELKGRINIALSTNRAMMTSQIKLKDILKLFQIDKEVNRDLTRGRIPDIIKYIKNSNKKIDIYFPSFVFSFRENPVEYYDKENSNLILNDKEKLVVIDGQHRLYALKKLVSEIENPKEREVFLNNTITCQIYFGLDLNAERKLFTDINSNVKKVSLSLATKYDTRDIMNILIQELYSSSDELEEAGIELNKSRLYRPSNKKFSTAVRLKEYIAYLIFGKKHVNNSENLFLKENYDEILLFLKKYFFLLFSSLPETPGDVEKYVLGHRSFQNAIALYSHNIVNYKKEDNKFYLVEEWEELIELLKYINWDIDSELWSEYLFEVGVKKVKFLGCNEGVEDKIQKIIDNEIFFNL